jgi:hypothetical protein
MDHFGRVCLRDPSRTVETEFLKFHKSVKERAAYPLYFLRADSTLKRSQPVMAHAVTVTLAYCYLAYLFT